MFSKFKSNSDANKKAGYFIIVLFAVPFFSGIFLFSFKSGDSGLMETFLKAFSFDVFSGDVLNYFLSMLLTQLVYAGLGLFLSLSVFGFALLPFVCFILGMALSFSVYEAYLIININVMVYYLPFWVITAVFIMNYLVHCFYSSKKLFYKLSGINLDDNVATVFKISIKDFYFTVFVLFSSSMVISILEYLISIVK